MKIEQFRIRVVKLPLKVPFQTHQSTIHQRHFIIIEAVDASGIIGYGEVSAFSTPFYTSETVETAWDVIQSVLIPATDWSTIGHPADFYEKSKWVHGHQMAKAGIEGALWDVYGKRQGKSLSEVIGGKRHAVKAGAVLSLSSNPETDLMRLKEEGYERIKLKVQKGKERETIETVRNLDADIPLMIDANGQYEEKDLDLLSSLDEFNLMMIEQPFQAGDFFLHQKLQSRVQTPICLDESIASAHDAVQAIALKCCRVINIKISRVGGLSAALQIHDFAKQHDIPVWAGGMIESGISKAHHLALASLDHFTIPGDLSGSKRYFTQDLVTPEIQMKDGEITVPSAPGLGFDIDEEYMDAVTVRKESILL